MGSIKGGDNLDTLYWLWLRDIEKLSATKKQKLLEKFESPQAIYRDAAELLVVENITLSDAQNIVGINLDSAKNQKTTTRKRLQL